MSFKSVAKDLGTYHVKVELTGKQGFIYQWNTARRYCNGTEGVHPLGASSIECAWNDESHLIETIIYQFTDGNYGCDCNKRLFLSWAKQQSDEKDLDFSCGAELQTVRLTLIRPDGSEKIILENL